MLVADAGKMRDGAEVINIASLFLMMMLCCFSTSLHADDLANNVSQQGETSLSPIMYPMKFVYIFEGNAPQVIIAVGNAGFTSIASLKSWAGNLPAGTTLEFDMACRRLGIEPLVNSENEMNDFKEFCKQHNIQLVIRPSG